MIRSHWSRPALAVFTMGLGSLIASLSGCEQVPATGPGSAASTGAAVSGAIGIDGSSTVFKLSQAMAQEFNLENPGVAMKVDQSGTSGGFKKFVEGKLDICDASRPIKQEEIDKCKANGVEYIELPVALDALTVAVNIDNDWCDALTTAELKKLWEPAADGKIMNWSQVREGWPDEKMALFGPGHSSGTFDYFAEVIVDKKEKKTRADFTASEDDNAILLGIEGDKNALGYVPFAYFAPREGKTMKAVKIDSGAGPIAPSVATVKDASYLPLSRPLFIYVNRKAAERPEVKAFVEYYLQNAESMSAAVGYIPLEADVSTKVAERFKNLEIGSNFGGSSSEGKKMIDIISQPLQP